MNYFELNREFYNHPIMLTDEEKKDPLSVIQAFFDDVKLIEVRIPLYNLLEVALTKGETVYDDAMERDAVLCFVKKLARMVEAASLL